MSVLMFWLVCGLINYAIQVVNYGRFWKAKPVFFFIAFVLSMALGSVGLFIKLWRSKGRPFIKYAKN